MSAQFHRHILVVYHLHPRDILLYPIGLELILLPVGQEVVDGVLQPTLVATCNIPATPNLAIVTSDSYLGS
jgi:hypothetical protein